MSDTLRELVASAAHDSDCLVVTYSDRAAADGLWDQLQSDKPLQSAPSIVILFDDLPDDWKTEHPFRPEFWLTPWDWALAMSTRLVGRPELLPEGGFRCWIVDLLPAESAALGRQRFKMARAFVPWIRTYRPVDSRSRTAADDVSELWDELSRLAQSPALDAGSLGDPATRALSAVWLSLLAAPGDRHAIGNLVGPLLLAEGVETRMGRSIPLRLDWPTLHFRTLLRAVGFATTETRASSTTGGPVVESQNHSATIDNDLFGQCERVRWLLVDDHALLGYHDALAGILFGDKSTDETDPTGNLKTIWNGDSRRLALRSISHPTELLNELEVSFRADHDWKTARVLGESQFDILFIDLRLFPKSTTESASDEERRFLGALLAFCAAERRSWPKDNRLDNAIAAAQRRRDGGREELAALTLLPLLLSHADPSLPLILFSSSHQYEVAHAFEHRANVITSFSKPIVTGYAHIDTTSLAVDELMRAITESLRLHRLRPVWKAIAELNRVMAGRDWAIVEDRLQVHYRDHRRDIKSKKTFRLRLESGMIGRIQLEFSNLLVRQRFADALLAPHNILEYCYEDSDDLVSPDHLPNTVDYMGAVADLQFYRVLSELRNARAHYQCQPIRDDASLEQPAYWSWLLFIKGCKRLVEGGHPIVPGRGASDSQSVAEARQAWLLPLVNGLANGPGKDRGFKRCQQIIGKLGKLLDRELLDMPGDEFEKLAAYAKHLATP